MEEKKRLGLMGRIGMSTKMGLMSVVLAFIALAAAVLGCRIEYSERISELIKNDMIAVAVSYGRGVEKELHGRGGQLTAEELEELVGRAVIPNDENGYIYIVSEDGTMLYHPTADKIGAPVENDAVKGLVAQLKSGTVPEPDVVEYIFKGQSKYAGFYIANAEGIRDIVVVSADLGKITKEVSGIPPHVIMMIFVLSAAFAVCALLLSKWLLVPIKRLAVSMDRVANLDFTKDADLECYKDWKNETGTLARATLTMSDKIDDITLKIKESVQQIVTSSEELQSSIGKINVSSVDISATTQEMAAGMEETNASTGSIATNMKEMVESSGHVTELADQGIQLTQQIYGKVKEGMRLAVGVKEQAEGVLVEVKSNAQKAIEEAKAIERINELTESIRSVTDQTNLLALNASIEAARAGEAGRGFAVVADEIGKLAGESSTTVNQINDIITGIKSAVDNLVACLTEVLEFSEKSTEQNLVALTTVGKNYAEDTESFEKSLVEMKAAMDELNHNITLVDTAITGINSTINESSTAINEVAEKTEGIVLQTKSAEDRVNRNVEQSESLHDLIAVIKL